MLVLGIDPGTATTGFGIVEERPSGDLELITHGVILTAPDQGIEFRLKKIYDEISTIIALHRPDSSSVEKLFFQKNVTNAMAVGQARGVIILALATAGIPIFEYTPNEVKQSVTGYGSADKKQVQKMVQTLLAMDDIPRPDDAADALAIAICHLHASGYKRLTTLDS
jgi:crossover junction endodeoxyribonuclease RuvC